MILTNKHISFHKDKVLLIILYMVSLALFFFTVSNLPFNFNELPLSYDSGYERTNIGNLRLLVLLMIVLITILTYLALFFWKRSKALIQESLQIKSELNQYILATISEEGLKLSQDEARRQALMLNERQQKIVDLMAFGLSNKQIADRLFISENTVKYHIKNIYHLLHVKDRKTLWLSQS
jgi:DNA-binding CsgD family transcriptional regulator